MNRTAVTRSCAVIAALVILATGFAIREARADRLQQRWMLPRNTAEFTYARLGPPYGVAVDGQGNVYVADNNYHRIQKFNTSDNGFSQWGSFGTGDGQFNSPNGVALDGQGNVYVADSGNHRIQKFDSNSSYLGQWGSPGSGDGQFYYPRGVAVDGQGNVYIADTSNQRVVCYARQWDAITPVLHLLLLGQ